MSDKPQRIQLSRRKGWRMPANTVSVARPHRWGNPFRVGIDGDAAECVRKFESSLFRYRHGGSIDDFYGDAALLDEIELLRGKNLACWCKIGEPCHADVLLRLANEKKVGEAEK